MIVNLYSHHQENAGRNFLSALLLVVVAIAVGRFVAPALGVETVRVVLVASWPVFAIFAGAVLALIYRLTSDTGAVGKLDRAQRYELEKIVRKKSWKLWVLFVLILIPLGLAIIGQHLPIGQRVSAATALAVAAVALIFFFAYVPATWLDLRAYVAQMDLVRSQQQAANDVLQRLKK